MKRVLLLIAIVFMMSFASAQLVINQQPDESYNFGDVVSVPVKIVALTEIQSTLSADSICSGFRNEFLLRDVILSTGEEEAFSVKFIVNRDRVGGLPGTCLIKFVLGNQAPVLTKEFKISNLIILKPDTEKTEFLPGDSLIVRGEATRENGVPITGFIDVEILGGGNNSEPVNLIDTVDEGFFLVNYSIPDNLKAGKYSIKLNVYEKGIDGNITNSGFSTYSINILQVSSSLEVAFENPSREIEPGTIMKIKGILYDQTGEKMPSSVFFTVKNNEGKLIEETERSTGDFLEIPILPNEPPLSWTVIAESEGITSEVDFNIAKKEAVSVELINSTVIIKNIGNVFYNKTLLIKVGDNSLNVNPQLDVDKSRKYSLTAPDGEYNVDVLEGGQSKASGSVVLTGKVIDVKESSGFMGLMNYPFVWVFIIGVLGFATFVIFKRGHKRTFYAKNKKGDSIKNDSKKPVKEKSSSFRKPNIKNRAEVSLSIQGEKQGASVVCLRIKNFDELDFKEDNSGETLNKIIDMAENKKAFIYENQSNLFFILAPVITKTFKNEKTALGISNDIRKMLGEHNKKSKQKIEIGISLNYGNIVAKKDDSSLKFMSMGDFITMAKKISSMSNGEILLSSNIKDKLMSDAKMEKKNVGGVDVYTVSQIKNRDGSKKFIGDVIKRLERK